jgi:hypothetical protein
LALTGLLQIAHRRGETATILSLLQKSLERGESNDVTLESDVIYYELLLNKNEKSALETAVALATRDPGRIILRRTSALAYLRNGDAASALKTFQEVNFEWQRASVSTIAVYAAVLKNNGLNEAAQPVTRYLSSLRLLPEEEALWKDAQPISQPVQDGQNGNIKK